MMVCCSYLKFINSHDFRDCTTTCPVAVVASEHHHRLQLGAQAIRFNITIDTVPLEYPSASKAALSFLHDYLSSLHNVTGKRVGHVSEWATSKHHSKCSTFRTDYLNNHTFYSTLSFVPYLFRA